jgi:hypothetical protein
MKEDFNIFHPPHPATRWLGFMVIVVYLAVAFLELFFLYIIWQLYKWTNKGEEGGQK